MNKRFLNHCILIGLALVFIAPGIAAYFFYQHPSFLGASKVNKGILFKQPQRLKTMGKQNKWKIILWQSGDCDTVCLQQLNDLSRIRLALGRHFYEVDEWLFLDFQAPPLKDNVRSVLKQNNVSVNALSFNESKQIANLGPKIRVFIANPEDYLILGYASGFKSKDLYADLKLLLNTTRNKRE